MRVHYPTLCAMSWEEEVKEEDEITGLAGTVLVKHICSLGEHKGDHICTCHVWKVKDV